jgi:hypothetical protein
MIGLLGLAAFPAAAQDDIEFEVGSPFDVKQPAPECLPAAAPEPPDPAVVFERMKQSSELAVACVTYLDRQMPDWHQAQGASDLVVTFVEYLLGDGTLRGLQRHEIFIELMGPLEKIDPGWRWSPALDPLMPRIILESAVEDPFVADFWNTVLQEGPEDWRDSDAADSVVPDLYQHALQEANEPAVSRNHRPKSLLLELSWPQYLRLQIVTRVLDSWPKRILSIAILLFLLAWAALRLRRR